MIPMTLREIAEVVDGAVEGDPQITVDAPAAVDSRLVDLGGLFVAFVGEHADGHDFAAAAIRAGAAAVMGSRSTGQPGVVVRDPLGALARLAGHVAQRLTDVRVVAITGSQGKTSAKDMLSAVLSAHAPTIATYGSFNNELGLPLTVLRADPGTSFLVVEMGARGKGHLADLCRIVQPDVSVVLNVGKAHIGEFGDQAAIAAAKGEIVEALTPDGVAVLNADDPLVAAMASRTVGRVVTFGESSSADVRIRDLDVDATGRAVFGLTLADVGETHGVNLPVVGEHQAFNAAAAAAAAAALGVPAGRIASALSTMTAMSKWRMEVHETARGITLINDSYNASPDSMRAALKALTAIGRGRGPDGRTVAVLGEMRELGESSREEHDAVGRLAVRLDIGQLLVIGEPARPLHLGASLEGSWGEESVFVPDKTAAAEWLSANLRPGDVVLLKASRGVALEDLVDVVLAAGGGPA